MRPLTLSSLLAIFALSNFAFAHPFLSSIRPREDIVSPVSPVPGIVTRIHAHDGSDITSKFQILLYQGPAAGVASSSNLTDRDLAARQGPVGTARPINTCKLPGYVFQYSTCDYHKGFRNSMQRYRTVCGVPADLNRGRGMRSERGVCNRDEICIDGPRTAQGRPGMASCISQSRFREIDPDDSTEQGTSVDGPLGEKSASAVVSKMDKSTPLSLEKLEIDTGVVGEGSSAVKKTGPIRQDYCTDCVEAATGKLMTGTDFLKTEATVSSAAAVGGVLWLAILSG